MKKEGIAPTQQHSHTVRGEQRQLRELTKTSLLRHASEDLALTKVYRGV